MDWLDHWQTMITGVLAVGAAAWAASISRGQLGAARSQILEQRDLERRTRQARLRAVRATLPSALSSVCGYAKQVSKRVQDSQDAAEIAATFGDRPGLRREPMPSFPSETLAILERVIEFVEADEVAKRIESILREAQILDVRIADRSRFGALETAPTMLQAASVYARAESLFDFARNQSDTVDTTDLWDRTFAAFRIFGLNGERWQGVRDFAQRSRDRGNQPGEADDPREG